LRRTDALLFEALIYPRHNEKVPGTGHDRARTGEEQIGEGIPHRADAKLVAGIVLPEKVDDIEHFPAFVLRVIEPSIPRRV
jgi:hypothetical protein